MLGFLICFGLGTQACSEECEENRMRCNMDGDVEVCFPREEGLAWKTLDMCSENPWFRCHENGDGIAVCVHMDSLYIDECDAMGTEYDCIEDTADCFPGTMRCPDAETIEYCERGILYAWRCPEGKICVEGQVPDMALTAQCDNP